MKNKIWKNNLLTKVTCACLVLYNIYNIYIYNAFLFSHNDFQQKRTHNATSMNAIQNNFICYTLSISPTPSNSYTPTRPRTSRSFLLHETQLFGSIHLS